MTHTERDFCEAIDLAEEAIGYVSDYFVSKWGMGRRLSMLKMKMNPDAASEFWNRTPEEIQDDEDHRTWGL